MVALIPIVTALTAIIPSIAKWIGGDKAEDAAQQLANLAKTVTGISDPEQAISQVLSDPIAQLTFMTEVEKGRVEMDRLYLADRQDARKNHQHSIFPAILCSTLTIGLIAFIASLLFLDIPEANMRLIDTVFGSYLTAWVGSCAYWNGTTRSSAEKNKYRM